MTRMQNIDVFREPPDLMFPPLVFFETKKQQTRLVVDAHGCVIELENKATRKTTQHRVKGRTIAVRESEKEYKERIGLVDIGDRKNWLYSKRLFLDEEDLKEQIALRLRHGCALRK